MADPDFAKGATAGPGYDTTPGGLGLSPAYLGGATANASLSASSTSGTSFPAAPADGQEYVYVADATNGVFWKFRWYAAGSYWAFIGGNELSSEVATGESTASASFVDLATTGPQIIVPVTATYILQIDGDIGNSVTDGGGAITAKIGAAGASDTDSAVGWNPAASGQDVTASHRFGPRSLTAGDTIKLMYRTRGGGTATFSERRLMLIPVKK